MKRSVILTFLLLTIAICRSQDNCTMKLSVRTEGLPAELAAFGEYEIVSYLKGEKSKTEISSMMMNSTVYFDGAVLTSLTEAMGNKTGYTATKEELEAADKADKSPKPRIEYLTEKKTIVGYDCTKAIITSIDKDKKELKTIVWVTDKIQVNPAVKKGMKGGMIDLGDLKGQPLAMESTQSMQGMEMKIRMTATEILTTSIPDDIFKADTTGYKMYGYKEFKEKAKSAGIK